MYIKSKLIIANLMVRFSNGHCSIVELSGLNVSWCHFSSGLKKSAAGLCVGMGSFSDPEELPGLAHFLEHMVSIF
jgi:hypothetical protein